MDKKRARPLTALTLGLATLLLASCASAGPVESQSTPEAPKPESSSAPETDVSAAGNYIPYESFQNSGAEYSDSNVVLFFNAAWCSTCKVARDNIEAALGEIPADLAIVVVDFDNSIELRKKYGVTVQHTFVQIDSEGEALGKWSGSVSVAEIVEQVI